ncbi:hypothetical protein ACFL32_00915 [Candidatus Neomarinimicrobiota bacterium]
MIDTETGESTVLDTIWGLTGVSSGTSAISNGSNVLYLIGNGRYLFSLDSYTGVFIDTVQLDCSFSGLEITSDDLLIGWTWNGTHEELRSIDIETGESTVLDTIWQLAGISADLSTMDFDLNELYLIGNGRQLFRLNPYTGALIDTVWLNHIYDGIEMTSNRTLLCWLWTGDHEELHSIDTMTGESTLLDTINGMISLSHFLKATSRRLDELYLVGNGGQLFTLDTYTGALIDTVWLDRIYSGIEFCDSLSFISSLNEGGDYPRGFYQIANYPNPFNPITTISYDLPQANEISLIIYNILGKELVRLADGYRELGNHQAVWNGRIWIEWIREILF